MKKLMFAAVAAAVTTGAFAAPLVYDYKASVKHMYLKEVKLSIKGGFSGIVYQKYQKSASLKGYLIMDEDGATSASYTGVCDNSGTYSADWGRNRGFLVVMNTSAESKVRAPKILPAVLDAKWIDTNFRKAHAATSGLAEGTLFVGGDSVAPLREKLELAGTPRHKVNATAVAVPGDGVPGLVAYADYVWTSVYLFGQFNGPNWFVDPATGESAFHAFETAWDGKLPAGVQVDWATNRVVGEDPINYYHDTWMNGAGFGKYAVPSYTTGDLCCGLTTVTTSEVILESLSGNLKGGLFLCTENGVDATAVEYRWFDGADWEDQFACCRDNDHAFTYTTDAWQNDLWQDGAVEQQTTDVLFGTWSIKYNKTFLSKIASELTADELVAIAPYAGTEPLWACFKGAARKLKSTAKLYDGTEIYEKTAGVRFDVPMVTPKFATYYGLK